jgi:hypothetical protein
MVPLERQVRTAHGSPTLILSHTHTVSRSQIQFQNDAHSCVYMYVPFVSIYAECLQSVRSRELMFMGRRSLENIFSKAYAADLAWTHAYTHTHIYLYLSCLSFYLSYLSIYLSIYLQHIHICCVHLCVQCQIKRGPMRYRYVDEGGYDWHIADFCLSTQTLVATQNRFSGVCRVG